MGDPAFVIIGDSVSEPLVARAYARKKDLGQPSLAKAFKEKGSLGEAISMRDFFPGRGPDVTLDDGASFPDTSVLLMIGNTKELVEACKKVEEDARILAIYTKPRRALTLLYARIDVSLMQDDTLIAIGQQGGLLPSPTQKGWHEYKNTGWQSPPTYVTTPDASEPYALPPIIRWIKENDGKAWLKP